MARAEDAEYWKFSAEEAVQEAPVGRGAGGAQAGRKRRREEGVGGGAARGESGGARVPWRHGRAMASELVALANGTSLGGALPVASLPAAAPLLRLHEEILDFVAFVSPTPEETETAARALKIITSALTALFPKARIEVFGSRANALVLPTSDWDIVLIGVAGTSTNMRRIAAELQAKKLVKRTEVIDSARVPIVKAWEGGSGIQIDISFDAAATSGLSTRACISTMLARHPPLRPLVVLLKYFLQQRGLNDTYSGGVGSFMLTLMAAHVAQAAEERVGGAEASGLNLGVLLLTFLELYGANINYNTTGITLRGKGGYFSKSSRGWYNAERPTLLSIENPVEPAADVGRNSWAVQRVRRACMYAHTSLARAVRAEGGGGMEGVRVAPAPSSLLAAVIRIDEALVSRAEEMDASVGTGPVSPSRKGRHVQVQVGGGLSPKGGPDAAALKGFTAPEGQELGGAERGTAAEAPLLDAATAQARALTALAESTRGTAITLRRPKLLADVLTRKERGVAAQAILPPEGGWY
jgi:hypothetical protein